MILKITVYIETSFPLLSDNNPGEIPISRIFFSDILAYISLKIGFFLSSTMIYEHYDVIIDVLLEMLVLILV